MNDDLQISMRPVTADDREFLLTVYAVQQKLDIANPIKPVQFTQILRMNKLYMWSSMKRNVL